MGCEVTAFSSNPAKEQEVLAMGADKVVNSRDPDALKALAGQFDLIINTVNVDPTGSRTLKHWPTAVTSIRWVPC